MLGPFGETLLLDWGLAKVLGQDDGGGGVSGARPLGRFLADRRRHGDGHAHLHGAEMAGGRAEDVDQRTDVYLLGRHAV